MCTMCSLPDICKYNNIMSAILQSQYFHACVPCVHFLMMSALSYQVSNITKTIIPCICTVCSLPNALSFILYMEVWHTRAELCCMCEGDTNTSLVFSLKFDVFRQICVVCMSVTPTQHYFVL